MNITEFLKTSKHLGMLASEAPDLGVKAVSSGVLGIDLASGIGGFPRGRIVEIFGHESVGKTTVTIHAIAAAHARGEYCAFLDLEHCLSGGSFVYEADHGRNYTCSELYKTGKEFSVISHVNGRFKKQTATIKKSGIQDIFHIKTKKGIILKLTENHKILTNNGYKRVRDLSIHDMAAMPNDVNLYKSLYRDNHYTNDAELDKYFLLGFYHGDGCRLKNQTPSFSKTDEETINFISSIVEKMGCEINKQGKYAFRIGRKSQSSFDHGKCSSIVNLFKSGWSLGELEKRFSINRESIKSILFNNGIPHDYDFRKHSVSIRLKKRETLFDGSLEEVPRNPNQVRDFLLSFPESSLLHKELRMPMGLTPDQIRHYLAGFFTADGTVVDVDKKSRRTISFSTSSHLMAKDIQSNLLLFGIRSAINKSEVRGFVCYSVIVNGVVGMSLFIENIPVISYKKRRIHKALSRVAPINDKSVIENELEYLKIRSIENHGPEETYDISVKNDSYNNQNFLCESLIIHNSYCPVYGRALGVQDDKLLFFQPDTLNEALDTIKQYCKIDEVGLIVLDSIAISATKMQSAANAGDANIASKARILSDQIGDIAAKCSVNNKTLLILNSYRKNPAATYGNPHYLPGGQAVPVAASMRIELSRQAPKQEHGGRAGNEVWAFFLKNKCSIPLKRTCFEIIYGKGVDNALPLFDSAVHYDVIHLKGRTYTLNGEVLGTSYEDAYKAFKKLTQEHEGIREKVISCVKEQGYTLEIKKS